VASRTSWARWGRDAGVAADAELPPPDPRFGVLFVYWQREPVYALGLAALSASVRRAFPDARVHLLPLFPHDDPDTTRRFVAALRPGLIAASAMWPTWLPLVPHVRAMKQVLPDVPVVVGGYQGIVDPAGTLAEPAVDFVCVGDGEEPLVDLIRRLRTPADATPIAGLWEKRGDETVRSPPYLVHDLGALPFPDYALFERDGSLAYLKPNAVEAMRLLSVPVLSGRGCPYRCAYCSNTTLLDLHGGKGGILRKHRPAALVAELARLRERYRVEFFQFWDEEFLYDAGYARELFAAYHREVGVPFSLFARPETMTEELCALAAASGCHSMWFGVESGSESYRRRYLDRRMPNARILDAAATAQRHGIKRMIFAMVGLPFETADDVRETLAVCRAIGAELTIVSQFLPFPGTPLHALCRAHELLLPPTAEQQVWPLGTLNLKEHPGGLDGVTMRALADEIMTALDAWNHRDA
jgi:anaerobic magnesium-protoporphyrin IX monomethyl ester cyclase